MCPRLVSQKTLALFALTASLALAPSAFAQKRGAMANSPTAAPVPQPAPAGEKLDVTELENKYWAAKDTDFSVVQNRLFSKAGRLAVTPQYGVFLNEPWSEGATLGLTASYYLSERYGIELSYSKTDSKDTDAAKRLRDQGGAPNHTKLKQFYGLAFNWVPFYAKMSVLNSRILYFDMSFSPGIGLLEYEQQVDTGGRLETAPAVTLDVTQTFFLSNWVALRFDLKNRWSTQDIANYRSINSTVNQEAISNTLLMFGATFYY